MVSSLSKMQGAKISPFHGLSKHIPSDTRRTVNFLSNPFDSDDELDDKKTIKVSGRASSQPSLVMSNTNPFEDEEIKGSSSSQHDSLSAKNRYKNGFADLSSTNPFEGEEIKGRSSSQHDSLSAKNRYKNGFADPSSTNPFEGEEIKGSSPSQHDSLSAKNIYKNGFGDLSSTNPFEDEEIKGGSSSQSSLSSIAKYRYKNNFRDSGGLENQSVHELENYAVYRAEETTETVNNCLKIAVDIREDATKTLVALHEQGEQILRTHMVAADMDHDLSRGEKLLGSLGGIFSKTWKPKKTRPITGPIITRDDPIQRKGNHLDQRERLGWTSASKERSRTPPPEPTNAMQKVEVEKVKQDDALSDLSNILGDLKEMAIDMGSEIDRQNKAMDHVQDDVEELTYRVKGANQRTSRLLGK